MCRSRCRPGGDRRSDAYAACGDNELGSNGNSDAEVGAGGVLNVEGTARRQLSWRQISQIAPLSRQRHQCDQGRVAGERGIVAPNCNLEGRADGEAKLGQAKERQVHKRK